MAAHRLWRPDVVLPSVSDEKVSLPPFLDKEPFVESIHQAQFKPAPAGFKSLSPAEIRATNERPTDGSWKPRQEPGRRPACPLPYELAANGAIDPVTKKFEVTFVAKTIRFGDNAAGAPFSVYAPGNHKARGNGHSWERCRVWNFAVQRGGGIKYAWNPADFEEGLVFLRVYGPNGFFREFQSDAQPPISVRCETEVDFDVILTLKNNSSTASQGIEIVDNADGAKPRLEQLAGGERRSITLDAQQTSGWYDFTVRSAQHPRFSARFAGHIENGKESISDPSLDAPYSAPATVGRQTDRGGLHGKNWYVSPPRVHSARFVRGNPRLAIDCGKPESRKRPGKAEGQALLYYPRPHRDHQRGPEQACATSTLKSRTR